jgi:hypothetical protein
MKKHLQALLGAVTIVAATTSVVRAQSGAAEIVGDVVDLAGAPVPHAALTVTDVGTTNERHLTADDRGRFTTTGLIAGEYYVTATAPGFAPRRQEDLVLAPNERATVRLALRRASLPETLTVAEIPATLETTRSDVHQSIEADQLDNLPNRERKALALSELVVATTVNPASDDPAVMAHDASLNSSAVDGFNRRNSLTGASRALAPLNAVNAFDERVNGYAAEAGGGAAVFNVATKAGTNRLHGSLFDFFGDRRLNGLKTIDQSVGTRPPYHSNQFGAVLGGPIVVNRDFFLLSYEGSRRTIAAGSSVNLSPFVSSDPRTAVALARLQALAAREPRASDRDTWMLKANHEFGSGGTLRLQYAEQRSDGASTVSGGPAPVVATTGDVDATARMFGALFGVAAGGFVNEMRAQYATDRDRETAGMPAVSVFEGGALVLRTGGSALGPHDVRTDRVQVSDTVSMATGTHAAKAGVEALLDQHDINPNAMARGSYVFRSLASFAGGLPSNVGESYTQTFAAGGDVSADVRTYSAFVQDTWRISRAATADFGVRYDVQAFTRGMPRDSDNWAPRVGLAIRRGEHAVIRSGYGMYYGFTPALIPAFALLDSGLNTITVTVRGAAAQAYPDLLTATPATPRSTTIVDTQFQNALVQQANVGYEFEKYRVGSVGVAYLFARGTHLPRLVETNNRGRFNRVAEYQSTGESLYNALTFRARLTRPSVTFDVAYTVARMDATPFGMPSVQFGTMSDRNVFAVTPPERRSPGDNDRHHHAIASLVYDSTARADLYRGVRRMLLRHWTLSFTYDVLSGTPYTAYADADLNGDGNLFNDLAPATTRNQYRLPWHISFNPRLSRDFHFGQGRKLSLIWEAFNLTNRPNYGAVDDILYTMTATGLQRNPLFGRATAQDESRVMQLAARVTF